MHRRQRLQRQDERIACGLRIEELTSQLPIVFRPLRFIAALVVLLAVPTTGWSFPCPRDFTLDEFPNVPAAQQDALCASVRLYRDDDDKIDPRIASYIYHSFPTVGKVRSLALVVNVSKYESQPHPELDSTQADADALVSALIEKQSFDIVVELSNELATADNIHGFLRFLLKEGNRTSYDKTPPDPNGYRIRFLFAFSGHGVPGGTTPTGRP